MNSAKLVRRHTGVLDPKLIEKLLARDEPVIISGALEKWNFYRDLKTLKTDNDKIRTTIDRIGNREILFTKTSRGGAIPYTSTSREMYKGTFITFAERALARSDNRFVHYSEAISLDDYPELGKVQFGKIKKNKNARLWIGFGGQVTNVHFDGFYNLMGMLAGSKRVTLFPHGTLPWMYPAPIDRGIGGVPTSCVRMLKPNLKKFPLYNRVLRHAFVATLQPGETLFIPPLWWHHVESNLCT